MHETKTSIVYVIKVKKRGSEQQQQQQNYMYERVKCEIFLNYVFYSSSLLKICKDQWTSYKLQEKLNRWMMFDNRIEAQLCYKSVKSRGKAAVFK